MSVTLFSFSSVFKELFKDTMKNYYFYDFLYKPVKTRNKIK